MRGAVVQRARLAKLLLQRQQQQQLHTSAIHQAVPRTESSQASSSGGVLSWFLGERPTTPVPALYEPLEGVHLPPALPEDVQPSQTKVTALANGLRIASENVAGPTSTIGIFVDSGSKNETPSCTGATHLLERMAFKSTANRSHFRLVREMEAIGGNVVANASRETMCYTGDAIKTFMPELVELLVDTVRNPLFNEWEVQEQLAKLKTETAEAVSNPQVMLYEALHSAGFIGGLGQPLMAPESCLGRLNGGVLHDFVKENYTAPRIVLAASGVDHEDLLSVAEPLLADLPSADQNIPVETQYVGGDWRQSVDSPLTHVAIAFEVPGGWRNEKDSYAVTVLQQLLGGGGSFSAGGPGKGMYSRLYTRVLNRWEQVQSFTAFNSIYNDTGLIGIHATSSGDFVPKLVDLACEEFAAVASPGQVTEAELQRAKNSTISAVLMNLESRVVITEDIARQILTYGHRKPVAEFIEGVQALTLEDIANVSSKIVATPLTMASWGNVVQVPRYDAVADRF
jgi:processing peptidase subunit alpha